MLHFMRDIIAAGQDALFLLQVKRQHEGKKQDRKSKEPRSGSVDANVEIRVSEIVEVG